MLNEAMKGPEDLPAGYNVVIEPEPGGALIRISRSDFGEKTKKSHQGPNHLAVITMEKPYDQCSNAWAITSSNANSGWGPLAYDIAIEWATKHAGGLAPDRESVSDDAYAVWNYYMKRRADVKSYQLDSRKNMLTPSKSDNCGQMSVATHMNGSMEDDITADDLKGSPLARYYLKKPVTINKLKQLGKLVIEN